MHLIKAKIGVEAKKKSNKIRETFVHQVNNATTRAENVFLGGVLA